MGVLRNRRAHFEGEERRLSGEKKGEETQREEREEKEREKEKAREREREKRKRD